MEARGPARYVAQIDVVAPLGSSEETPNGARGETSHLSFPLSAGRTNPTTSGSSRHAEQDYRRELRHQELLEREGTVAAFTVQP